MSGYWDGFCAHSFTSILFSWQTHIYQIAIPVLILNMTAPRIYYPFAIVWFGLTNVLGSIVSRVLLSFVFFGLVLPVGLLRRLFRKDALNLRNWKKDSASVMNIRNHVFSGKDLEKPY